MSLTDILREVRACQICLANLPFGPRPVLQLASTARLLTRVAMPVASAGKTGIFRSHSSGSSPSMTVWAPASAISRPYIV